jgi:hypothetical protein
VLSFLVILLIGLMPSLISVWVIHRTESRVRIQLRRAANSIAMRGLPGLSLSPDYQYIDGVGYMIGDLTCRFNARSSHLRCAVNPFGPCAGCSCYEQRPLSEDL